jgi:hypothetical protein
MAKPSGAGASDARLHLGPATAPRDSRQLAVPRAIGYTVLLMQKKKKKGPRTLPPR